MHKCDFRDGLYCSICGVREEPSVMRPLAFGALLLLLAALIFAAVLVLGAYVATGGR